MKTVETKLAAQNTLFDTYAPVERYLQELQSRSGQQPAPPVPLLAEDAYLMHAFVGSHPQFHAVFDLAAGTTWGATTVLWASQERRCRVYTPELGPENDPMSWTGLLRETLEDSECASRLEFVSSGLGLTELLGRCREKHRPGLVVIAPAEDDAESPSATLRAVFSAHPKALVLLLGLGRIGEDPRLGALLEWARTNESRLAAFRELSPFLAGSRLAVVFPRHDIETPETLKRLQRLFTGNFDFLTLAQQVYTLSRTKAKLEAQLQEAAAQRAPLELALQEAHGKVAELDLEVKWWAKECEQTASHAAWVEHRLRSMSGSRSWRLVQRIRSVRHTLVPRNSLRERCGKYLMLWQRKLRGWLRPAA